MELEIVWTGNVHAAHRGYLCVPVHPIVPAGHAPEPEEVTRRKDALSHTQRFHRVKQTICGERWWTIREIHEATGIRADRVEVALNRCRREGSLQIVKLTGAARQASGWTAYRVPA
jgi:hypothetical protein